MNYDFSYVREAFSKVGVSAEDAANAFNCLSEAMYDFYYGVKEKSNNWLKMHGYPMRRRIKKCFQY